MSLSSVELWQKISAAGLAAPMICRTWAAEALQGLPPSAAVDADKILTQLVKIGRLTNYQADLIAGRRQGEFKRGAWTLLRPVAVPFWGDWFEANKSPTTPTTWLRWLDSQALTLYRTAAPSLPRGLGLARVQGKHLQAVLLPELIDKQLQLQVAPISGLPLSIAFAKDPNLVEQATLIVHQVAEALKPLHAAGIAHGRVLPDRIYWDAATSEVTLARDPLCAATATLDATAIGVVEQNLAGLATTQFLAPEFLTPGQLPTVFTDIYSLGCTWWWLVTGRPLVVGSTMEKQLARQAEATLAIPKDCSLPAPFVRVLQHCLAKNLPARFASADSLFQALEAAGAVVARGQIPRVRMQPEVTTSVAAIVDSQLAQPAKNSPAPVQTTATTTNKAKVQTTAASLQSTESVKPQVEIASKAAAGNTEPAVRTPPARPAEPRREKVLPEAERLGKPLVFASEAAAVASSVPVMVVVPAAPVTAPTNSPLPVASKAKSEISSSAAVTKSTAPVSQSGTKSIRTLTQPLAHQPTVSAPGPDKQIPEKQISEKQVAVKHTLEPVQVTESQVAESKPAAAKILEPQPTENKAVAEKSPAKSKAAKSSTKRKAASAATKRKAAKRQKANKWLLPVVGGFGFISLLLFAVLLRGGLSFNGKPKNDTDQVGNIAPPVTNSDPEVRQRDPRLDLYRIVSSGKDTLWAPPAAPQPLKLDLLPPGGQMFLSFHPKTLLTSATAKTLLSALSQDVTPWLASVSLRAGQPLESISQCTVAFYAENETPVTCLRVILDQPQPLSTLKNAWGITSEQKLGMQTLLTSAAGESFYIAAQPLTDVQSVTEFSLGPTKLMREVAESEGAAAPLVTHMEKLWQASDSEADFSLLLAPSYLFSEGKLLLAGAPKRLTSQVTSLLGADMRAALLQTRLEPEWYLETQMVGLQDRDTGRISQELHQRILSASAAVEEWLVSESAHPYWRPLALRFPQMLRTLGDQARFGVESGVAIANAYLPQEAAANVLLASWIALQNGATLASEVATVAGPTASTETAKPLTLDEYLGRSIKLSFDQEPIEVALKLVGDEANANLPAGTPLLRFELDGGAFEKAGITRNQQLRDFKHVDKPVRDALTTIAKRGNPVTTVTDTRDKDQRLIWVIRDDPQQAGRKLVSLTTREAATAASIPLTVEFAPTN